MRKLKSNPRKLTVVGENEKGKMKMRALARKTIQALEKRATPPTLARCGR